MEVPSSIGANWSGLQQVVVKWFSKGYISSYILKLFPMFISLLCLKEKMLSIEELIYHGFMGVLAMKKIMLWSLLCMFRVFCESL